MMKTEQEIRRHREALRRAVGRPCSCRENGHSYECAMGGHMMQATIAVLSWVLGEAGEKFDGFVDQLEKDVSGEDQKPCQRR